MKDGWIAPEAKSSLAFIRYAIFSPFLVGVLLFSFSGQFRKYHQLCLSLVLLLGGLSVVAMNVVAPDRGNYVLPAGIMLFLMSPSFLRLRFVHTFVASWLLIAGYEIVALRLLNMPSPLLLTNNVYLITANLIALLTSYLLELYARKDYLQQGEQRIASAVFNSTTDGIIVTDAAGAIQSVNAAFERITGYNSVEVKGKTPRILQSGLQDKDFYEGMWKVLLETGTWKGKFWNKRKNGELYPQETTINAIKNDRGETVQYSGILRDVTEQEKLEETLRMLSSTDGLTGLANRRSFDEAIREEWRRAQRLGYPIAIIMADIDYFKKFNDTYGHVEGDECLKKVGSVLKNAVRRAGDLAARYGGEEFVLILPMTDAKEVAQIAEAIRKNVEVLKIPHESSDAGECVTLSMGAVSVTPHRDMSVNDFITLADKTLYEAKRSGRNRVVDRSGPEFKVPGSRPGGSRSGDG